MVALLKESEIGEHGLRQEKESEMALPKLVGADGREAVLSFTGMEPLRRWRPDARPIQATILQVCQAAVHEDTAAVVIDVVLGALRDRRRPAAGTRRGRIGHRRPVVLEITVARMEEIAEPPRRRRFGWPPRGRG